MKNLNFKGNIIKVVWGIVQTESLPTIEADPIQMRQLLQNLISKAIKFKKKEKAPKFELAPKQYENGFWDISVKDNGIGFDSQHVDSIFQPYFRLNGWNQYEGSGIGRAICKKIVDRHHGKIKAISSQNEGSIFQLTLPIKQVSCFSLFLSAVFI